MVIAMAAGLPRKRELIELALDRVTTGFVSGYTTATAKLAVARKTDGTNWRRDEETVSATMAGN